MNDLKNKEKTKLSHDIVRSDLNLERYPIFTTKHHKGVRIIKLEGGGRIEIGLPGSTVNLGTGEWKLFLQCVKLWRESGEPNNGEFEKSFSKIMDLYFGDTKTNRKYRRGNYYKKRFVPILKNLMRIPLVWVNSYQADGGTYHAERSFTLLQSAVIFERTDEKYFNLSKITIHPFVVESLKKYTKPVLFDVVKKIKGEYATILYRHLDPVLTYKDYFNKDLFEFCEYLGIKASRKMDLVRRIIEACKELIGLELSGGGRIGICEIEKNQSGEGYNFVARKSKPLALPEKTNTTPSAEINDEPALEQYYETLTVEEKALINTRAVQLIPQNYQNNDFTKKMFWYKAIREHQYT